MVVDFFLSPLTSKVCASACLTAEVNFLSLFVYECLILNINLSDIYSEWVLGNREDLVEDIIAEIQPENGEVMMLFA